MRPSALADVARELDLAVFSDEIHADLTYPPFRHLPFAAPPDHYLGGPCVLGRVATVAAWDESEEWHAALMRRPRANREALGAWAAAHPSGLRLLVSEATYLAGIDQAVAGGG